MSSDIIQTINNLALTIYMCTGNRISEENPITIELPYEDYLRVSFRLRKNASYKLNGMRISEFTPEFKVNTSCGLIIVKSKEQPKVSYSIKIDESNKCQRKTDSAPSIKSPIALELETMNNLLNTTTDQIIQNVKELSEQKLLSSEKVEQKEGCPKCGHPGSFIAMALCCPEHGMFVGC